MTSSAAEPAESRVTTVGIIASPSAGKDVRRLVANAGSSGDVDKVAMIRRAALGAVEAGIDRLLVLDDSRHLILRALQDVVDPDEVTIEIIDLETMGTGRDSVRAAAVLEAEGVGGVVVFGGDGTSRDVAKGWADAPMVPLAVGTNNVFPLGVEPTLGGLAAGLVAAGVVTLEEVSRPAKVIHVDFGGGDTDLALVDVVLVDGDFIGSRAVWHVEDLREAVFAIAEPASVGLSAIGAALRPTPRDAAGGVHLRIGPGELAVRVPIAPGTYETVEIADQQAVAEGEAITLSGPGVLAFDGERDHVLGRKETAVLTIRRDGPRVIDPVAAVELATAREHFHHHLIAPS